MGGRRRHAHDSGDQREKGHGLVQHTAAITLVDGIEHCAVPYVQPILQGEIHQRNGDDHERQYPRGAPPTVPPEAQGRFPKTCKEVLTGLLIRVRNHRSPLIRPRTDVLRAQAPLPRGATTCSVSLPHSTDASACASL